MMFWAENAFDAASQEALFNVYRSALVLAGVPEYEAYFWARLITLGPYCYFVEAV